MENARDADDGYTTQSTTYCPEAAHGNGMFSSSHHFTVTARSLTNITKNYTAAPSVPSDIRMIPLGDIDLQHEIRVNNYTGEVNWWQGQRAGVRRIYSARIEGRKSSVTVAMYQGDGAEEEWRQDLTKHMAVRHPNIIQIAGIANSGGIQAALFTDDLIPSQTFRDLYCHSHSLLVYFYVRCSWDYYSLEEYLVSTLQWEPINCTKWVRRSTGRFCVELNSSDYLWTVYGSFMGSLESSTLIGSNTETTVIDSLTLRDYHQICAEGLSLWCPLISHLAPTAEITVGAVLCGAAGDPFEDLAEIVVLVNPKRHLSGWYVPQGYIQIMGNGWTRLNSHDVQKNHISFIMCIDSTAWLSQANHIFHCLGIVSNFENYVMVDRVSFHLNLLPSDKDTPPGFLFLCPAEEFRTGQASFCWPDLPAYWSLDPLGADRLSAGESVQLGFPTFQLTTDIDGKSWNASVYDGVRKFHEAKGFDPDSQDVALHLGDPLYRLSCEVDKEDYWGGVYGYHQSGDYLRALFAENMADDDASSCAEETHESGTIDCGPDPTEASNCQNSHGDHKYEFSALDPTIAKTNFASHTIGEEISPTFKVFFNIQLTLILFLGMSWLYEQM